jgi:glycosyltransferase involved in cell wall biosynthesis
MLRTEPQPWFLKLPKNFALKIMPFPKFWTQIRLSWEFLQHSYDRLLIPASALPIFHPRKSVVVIHDTAWRYYPQSFTFFMRWYLELSTRFVGRFAWRLIAVSEATRQDLVNLFHINPEKVVTVYHGYTPQPEVPHTLSPELAAKLPEQYVLFLSTIQPRKNLVGLIAAFADLKKRRPDLPHRLVVVGKPGWRYEESMVAIQAHPEFVVYLNHVSNEDRAEIYKKASGFCVPSFYEGFGMWILEAYDAGVPVLVSNVSSLPEIGGESCLYCDPHSMSNISQQLERLLTDEPLRQQLIAGGKQRVHDFSWRRCATETLAVLQSK